MAPPRHPISEFISPLVDQYINENKPPIGLSFVKIFPVYCFVYPAVLQYLTSNNMVYGTGKLI